MSEQPNGGSLSWSKNSHRHLCVERCKRHEILVKARSWQIRARGAEIVVAFSISCLKS